MSSSLTFKELKALKRVSVNRRIESELAIRLAHLKYVRVDDLGDKWSRCSITPEGERYIESYNAVRVDRIWTRTIAIIATFISAAALIISAISLLLQLKQAGLL